MLDVWLGKTKQGRDATIEEAFVLAYSEGDWKYITPGVNCARLDEEQEY